jgi:hypothetical protein
MFMYTGLRASSESPFTQHLSTLSSNASCKTTPEVYLDIWHLGKLTVLSVYIPMSYPQYAASLFAGNDFCRALFAFGK